MTVEFDELSAFVLNALKARLETNRGLAIFARERRICSRPHRSAETCEVLLRPI